MPDKKIESFDFEKALERIIRPSIFDRLVQEIDADEIPTEYIEKIIVYYNSGAVVELKGDEIEHPVPINREGTLDDTEEIFSKMSEVKVIVNTEKLENDVNHLVNEVFNGRC